MISDLIFNMIMNYSDHLNHALRWWRIAFAVFVKISKNSIDFTKIKISFGVNTYIFLRYSSLHCYDALIPWCPTEQHLKICKREIGNVKKKTIPYKVLSWCIISRETLRDSEHESCMNFALVSVITSVGLGSVLRNIIYLACRGNIMPPYYWKTSSVYLEIRKNNNLRTNWNC